MDYESTRVHNNVLCDRIDIIETFYAALSNLHDIKENRNTLNFLIMFRTQIQRKQRKR